MRTQRTITSLPLILCLNLLIACRPSPLPNDKTPALTDRQRDGLSGAVKAVLTDDVVFVEKNGLWTEGQQASAVWSYDEAGKRILQTPFRINLPNGFAITQHESFFDPQIRSREKEEPLANNGGKWIKVYDDRGYVISRSRYGPDGKLMGKEAISYEFDDRGNWIKRTNSRLIDDKGAPQPVEASYRHFVYFSSSPAKMGEKQREVGAKQIKSPIAPTDANLASGRSYFNQKCAPCHGENGKAQTEFALAMEPVKPAVLASPEIGSLADGEIYSVISNGIKTTGMPAFKGRMSDQDLWQIVLYVKRLAGSQSLEGQNAIAAAPSPTRQAAESAPVVTERRYPFKGKIVSIQREQQEVTVEHEDIPGYMGAMTMPFPLKDEQVLNRLRKDDYIQATLVVDRNGWRLINVMIR